METFVYVPVTSDFEKYYTYVRPPCTIFHSFKLIEWERYTEIIIATIQSKRRSLKIYESFVCHFSISSTCTILIPLLD